MIPVGTLCLVIRATARPWFIGRVCEVVELAPGNQSGSLKLRMSDGVHVWGDPRNVRPIAPPSTTLEMRKRLSQKA